MRPGFFSFASSLLAIPLTLVLHYHQSNNSTDLETSTDSVAENAMEWMTTRIDLEYPFEDQIETDNIACHLQQALIVYIGTYLILKIASSVTRTVVISLLITLLMCKILSNTIFFEYMQLVLSKNTHLQISSILHSFEKTWRYHKPHIGDYFEDFGFFMVDTSTSNAILSFSALFGMIAYFIFGSALIIV